MVKKFFIKKIIILTMFVLIFFSISSASERIDFKTDIKYIGAFRLPNVAGDHLWDYGGFGLAVYPNGDKNGPLDGYPGSLYSSEIYTFVSEFSIPVPIISTDLTKLNTATTLTPFYDITDGKLALTLAGASINQLRGMTYLGPQEQQDKGKLYWAFWSSYNVAYINYPSHGYSDIDSAIPNAQGAWNVKDYHSLEVGGYLFDIPKDWADVNLDGKYIASGIVREGGTKCRGPALFATAPYKYNNTNPPPSNQLPVTALIYYNDAHDTYPNYIANDIWRGGSWVTSDNKEAVIFVGQKCLGAVCYGEAATCGDPCSSSKGYHCYPKQPQMVLYDTNDLADVAKGIKKPWDIQPYQVINLLDYIPLYNECTMTEGATYDRLNKLLYIIQHRGDLFKPLVHVFRVGGGGGITPPDAPQGVTIKKS